MKLGLFVLMGALALLGGGYYSSHWLGASRTSTACPACDATLLKTPEALAWMQRDFALSNEEFSKVCALHDGYLPRCDKMCQRMAAATTRLTEALKKKTMMTEEAQAALSEYEEAQAACQKETLKHLLDTAAVMKPDAGRAFVEEVLPHLLVPRRHVSDLQHSPAQP